MPGCLDNTNLVQHCIPLARELEGQAGDRWSGDLAGPRGPLAAPVLSNLRIYETSEQLIVLMFRLFDIAPMLTLTPTIGIVISFLSGFFPIFLNIIVVLSSAKHSWSLRSRLSTRREKQLQCLEI